MPATLLAAAVGGVGSLALSHGDVGAGAIGAAASGLGTALWNGITNADVRRMPVSQAIEQVMREQKEQ